VSASVDQRQPTALLSWAHQDESGTVEGAQAWESQVLRFANKLRATGIDVDLDLWHKQEKPAWWEWTERTITTVDYVIIAMNAVWAKRWNGDNDATEGTGVGIESNILRASFERDRNKFQKRTLIALLDVRDRNHIPDSLRMLSYFTCDRPDSPDYRDLLRALTGQPQHVPGELGPYPVLLPDDPADPPATGVNRSPTHSVSMETLAAETAGADTVAGSVMRSDMGRLPPAPLRFINRTIEVDAITATLERLRERGLRPVVFLSGAPGVGKSAVSGRWSHSNKHHFDVHLYTRLSRYRAGAGVAVDEMLGELLRQLGTPDELMTKGLANRTKQFALQTSGRNVLIVVDDALNPPDVTPVLPEQMRGATIVTTQSRSAELSYHGFELIDIAALNNDHSKDLLAEMIGESRVSSEPESVARLVEICCGLPMALCICGAQLAARPGLLVKSVVDSLDRADRNPLVEMRLPGSISLQACFDSAYRRLKRSQKNIYRIVGIHGGTSFDLKTVTAGANLKVDSVQRVLGELVQRCLIEDDGESRWRINDLLRHHARAVADQKISPDEKWEVRSRMIDYYLSAVQDMDRALVPDRLRLAPGAMEDPRRGATPHPEEAFAWFEAEHQNIVAAMQDAFNHGLDELVWQLGEGLWIAYHNRKHLDEAIQVYELAVEAARRCGNLDAEIRMRAQLARGYLDNRDPASADRAMAQVVELLPRSNNALLRASVIEWQGSLHLPAGRYNDAADSFEAARAIFADNGRARGVAMQDYQLGKTYNRQARFARAIEYLEAAAANPAIDADHLTQLRIGIQLGTALRGDGQPSFAREEFEKAIHRARQEGAADCLAEAHLAAAELDFDERRANAALMHLREAWQVYVAAGDPRALDVRARIDEAEA
jgi:tetratricopeptide (TPR) repeat protein